jgi:hypothetical protein
MKIRNISLFIIIISSSIAFAQTIGKIYTKDEADKLYGNVIESVQISVSEVNSLLNQTQDKIMFSILNNQLVLLGDNRKVLSATTQNISPSDVFAVYSKSKLLELLNYGNGINVYFEKRASRPTITFGLHTLEFATICPPICQ